MLKDSKTCAHESKLGSEDADMKPADKMDSGNQPPHDKYKF
jgi:hypothetical protein